MDVRRTSPWLLVVLVLAVVVGVGAWAGGSAAVSSPDGTGVTAPASAPPEGSMPADGVVGGPAAVASDPGQAPSPGQPTAAYRTVAFDIRDLPVGQRPYDDLATPDLTASPVVADANGVPMRVVGTTQLYSPVTVAQWALAMVVGFERTKDGRYLRRAESGADALRSVGVWSGAALYLPYRFDFSLHGQATDTLQSPWYSAMAQGQALSLMVHLYRATRDPADLATARALFLSLLHKGKGTTPWVTWIDSSRYLWLEEYAEPDPEHTLNGMMFAIFGLYDYYELTRDADDLSLLRGALTTIRYNAARYRNPGEVSAYCLKHRVKSLKYHHIVVAQLNEMAAITGATYFGSLAAQFKRDAW